MSDLKTNAKVKSVEDLGIEVRIQFEDDSVHFIADGDADSVLRKRKLVCDKRSAAIGAVLELRKKKERARLPQPGVYALYVDGQPNCHALVTGDKLYVMYDNGELGDRTELWPNVNERGLWELRPVAVGAIAAVPGAVKS